MSAQPFSTGGCRCKAITITVYAKPKMMVQCHCLDCQKLSGTGHTSNAYFATEDVKIEGEPSEFTVIADSGARMTRSFCPTCGSRLFGRNSERPDLVAISVGCLDDHSWYSPQIVLYASRKHDWDITADHLPRYDTMPPE